MVEGERVASLYQALLAALEQGSAVGIDAAAVCRISTPAIQVLVSAGASLVDAGLKLTYLAPSEEFIDAFSDLGLYAHLADHIEMG